MFKHLVQDVCSCDDGVVSIYGIGNGNHCHSGVCPSWRKCSISNVSPQYCVLSICSKCIAVSLTLLCLIYQLSLGCWNKEIWAVHGAGKHVPSQLRSRGLCPSSHFLSFTKQTSKYKPAIQATIFSHHHTAQEFHSKW